MVYKSTRAVLSLSTQLELKQTQILDTTPPDIRPRLQTRRALHVSLDYEYPPLYVLSSIL